MAAPTGVVACPGIGRRRGGSAFVPGFVSKHEAVWENSPCRNTHSVTSLHHADVWNMEQAVPRYHACFTVTAAALTESTYQTSDGAPKRTPT